MKMRPSSPPGKRGRTRTIGRKGPEFLAEELPWKLRSRPDSQRWRLPRENACMTRICDSTQYRDLPYYVLR